VDLKPLIWCISQPHKTKNDFHNSNYHGDSYCDWCKVSTLQLFAQNLVVTVQYRVCLFYFCRNYLLHSLYHDLRHLQLNADSQFASAFELKAHPLTPTLSPSPSSLSLDLTPHQSADNLTLPTPSTSSKRPARYSQFLWPSQQRVPLKILSHSQGGIGYQSSLARATFALCFSESCILFSMVMCQALRLLSPRYFPPTPSGCLHF
jgi:hypothetical protein